MNQPRNILSGNYLVALEPRTNRILSIHDILAAGATEAERQVEDLTLDELEQLLRDIAEVMG